MRIYRPWRRRGLSPERLAQIRAYGFWKEWVR
jgi:hypothetical protein